MLTDKSRRNPRATKCGRPQGRDLRTDPARAGSNHQRRRRARERPTGTGPQKLTRDVGRGSCNISSFPRPSSQTGANAPWRKSNMGKEGNPDFMEWWKIQNRPWAITLLLLKVEEKEKRTRQIRRHWNGGQ